MQKPLHPLFTHRHPFVVFGLHRYPDEPDAESARTKLELLVLGAGGGAPKFTGTKTKTGGIYDKLTDTSQYTGAHVHRFDKDGHGRGKVGRTEAGKCADLSEITRPNLRGPAHDAVAAGATDPDSLMAAAEERETLARTAFSRYDTDGSGFLTPDEVATLLKELEFGDADVAEEFAVADSNHDGERGCHTWHLLTDNPHSP